MDMLDYYNNGMYLFKENPPIIIMAVLLAALNFLLLEGVLENIDPGTSLYMILGVATFVILLLANSVVYAAVTGIIPKTLLKETITLKTAWEIGKKYTPKLVLACILLTLMWVILTIMVGIILFIIAAIALSNNMDYTSDITKNIFIVSFGVVFVFLSLFFTFVSQTIVIGQNPVIKAIKESINLVWNNKIKALILTFSMILIYSINLIPTIGSILGDIINPILSVYLLIVITQIYLDLTQ